MVERAAAEAAASTDMVGKPESGDCGVRGSVGMSAEEALEEGEAGTPAGTRSIIEDMARARSIVM
jgi:hypothetical protein